MPCILVNFTAALSWPVARTWECTTRRAGDVGDGPSRSRRTARRVSSESGACPPTHECRPLATAIDHGERHRGRLAGRGASDDDLLAGGIRRQGNGLATGDHLAVHGHDGVLERPEPQLT